MNARAWEGEILSKDSEFGWWCRKGSQWLKSKVWKLFWNMVSLEMSWNESSDAAPFSYVNPLGQELSVLISIISMLYNLAILKAFVPK